jgi:DNA-binding SARP family transcriptional activator
MVYQPATETVRIGATGPVDFLSMGPVGPGSLRIRLLGDFRVRAGARRIESLDWELRKPKNLVKILALEESHRMHRGELTNLLWPELSSDAASNNLHKAIHVVRRTFEPELPARAPSRYLQVRGDFVELTATCEIETDVKAFTAAARSALAEPEAAACLAALEYYGGDLLPEDRYEDWAITRRERLVAIRFDLLMCASQLRCAQGNLDDAVDLVQEAIVADPLNEEAHTHLILLFAQRGQRHLALQSYRNLCVILRDELGVEPEERTRQLLRQIVEGQLSAPAGTIAHMPVQPVTRDASTGPSPLFGRDAELAHLEQILDELYEDQGGLVVLRGEAGMGKTALANVVASQAQHLGILVTWLTGNRGIDALAFNDREPAALRAPKLIIVDDPDAVEFTSEMVWERLSRSMESPTVVLMSLPSEPSKPATRLDGLAIDLANVVPARTVSLHPLDDSAVELVARRLLGARVSPAVIDAVCGVAGGNPHYAEEAIRALLGRATIHCINGRWTFVGATPAIGRESLRRPRNHSASLQRAGPAAC